MKKLLSNAKCNVIDSLNDAVIPYAGLSSARGVYNAVVLQFVCGIYNAVVPRLVHGIYNAVVPRLVRGIQRGFKTMQKIFYFLKSLDSADKPRNDGAVAISQNKPQNDGATKIVVFILLFFLCFYPAYAASPPVSIDLKNSNLADTIRLFAKFLNMNIVMSNSINGVVTLHLHKANPTQAFELLLASHDLAKWQIGNIWFVAPRAELIKSKQEELKWQTVWNDALPLTTNIWSIKYSKAEDIARLLQDGKVSFLSKRGRVRVDTRTNLLCVQDISENMENIRRLIKRLDVASQQIVIEARLVSIDSDFERELGLSYSVKTAVEEESNHIQSKRANQSGRYSIAVATLADGSLLDVKLAALENSGHAELISSPSLFTANRQPASIEAGEEIPYQEVSESGGTAAVFKKAVLGLKVTPQVLPGNNVLLQLQINQDRPSNNMVQGVPTIRTRQIVTNVLVKSGHTVVLGGIYETNQEEGERRIPFISKIPLIGLLFKQKNTLENKRELLIFVTPKIMTSINENESK